MKKIINDEPKKIICLKKDVASRVRSWCKEILYNAIMPIIDKLTEERINTACGLIIFE
jgi:hypothetical protein